MFYKKYIKYEFKYDNLIKMNGGFADEIFYHKIKKNYDEIILKFNNDESLKNKYLIDDNKKKIWKIWKILIN